MLMEHILLFWLFISCKMFEVRTSMSLSITDDLVRQRENTEIIASNDWLAWLVKLQFLLCAKSELKSFSVKVALQYFPMNATAIQINIYF